MITIKQVLDKSVAFLKEKNIANTRRQAEFVIADSLELKVLDLYLLFDRPLTEDELDKCRQAILRRSKGEPSQYIRGLVEFHDCQFSVDPRALIPRHETEILVDKIIKELESVDLKGKVLWDICTGSGCIGITLKKRFPELKVTLSDLSDAALALAAENASRNEVKVRFKQGDLLEPFHEEKADFVVSNPPYVKEVDFQSLAKEVKDHEPKMALISGTSGLEIYERLNEELPKHLNPGAKVWMEMGTSQGDALMKIFSGLEWDHVRFECDWSQNDRFFFAKSRL